jgi:glucose-1-phosphate thymidylyltransferase
MLESSLRKAVVLCAGEGTRLRPLTFSRPKHLLPVAGKPLLGWALDSLVEAGIEQVGLVVGHRPEAIQRYVGDGAAWGLEATYLTQLKPLGLAHAVDSAREFLGDDDFLLYLGDNLLENGVQPLVELYAARRPAAALFVKEVPDPRLFGVVVTEGDRVKQLLEKPAEPPSNLAIVGAYAFSHAIMQAIRETPPSARGEYEITDAIQRLVSTGQEVLALPAEGFWEDAGRPAHLLKANRLYLDRLQPAIQGDLDPDCQVEGVVRIGRGTRAGNCRLLGPCLIGENCVLRDSTIGPYVSVGAGSAITESRVEDCIIQQDCRIQHLRGGLADSVLGVQVEVIGPEDGSDTPLRLLLGDMSSIRAF